MSSDPSESLTWRETEVLRLLDARLSREEIAEVLDISPAALHSHANSIYRKLMGRARHEAATQAHGVRLLPP
jgi:ATP/maltotriose-dependent transcriptional regulator MalT